MKKGDDTRARIVFAGVDIAADAGLHKVSARAIGRALDMSPTAVTYYFSTVQILRDAVASMAVAQGVSSVIARLIVDKHPAVSDLTATERAAYLALI